jgi:hypothetical protein
MTVERDAELAARRGMTFRVCLKEGPGRPWQTLAAGVNDLRVAMDRNTSPSTVWTPARTSASRGYAS